MEGRENVLKNSRSCCYKHTPMVPDHNSYTTQFRGLPPRTIDIDFEIVQLWSNPTGNDMRGGTRAGGCHRSLKVHPLANSSGNNITRFFRLTVPKHSIPSPQMAHQTIRQRSKIDGLRVEARKNPYSKTDEHCPFEGGFPMAVDNHA